MSDDGKNVSSGDESIVQPLQRHLRRQLRRLYPPFAEYPRICDSDKRVLWCPFCSCMEEPEPDTMMQSLNKATRKDER